MPFDDSTLFWPSIPWISQGMSSVFGDKNSRACFYASATVAWYPSLPQGDCVCDCDEMLLLVAGKD